MRAPRSGLRALVAFVPFALLALPVAGSAGCDWRDFDQIKSGTPVLSIGTPPHFLGTDVGHAVLPLSGPASGATGSRFLVSSASQACVGIIEVDAKGHSSGRSVSSPVFGTGDLTLPITSLAQVPGGNQILLGAPQANAVGSVYVMTLGASADVALLASPAGEDHFGLAVAAGKLAGADAPDFVVLSQSQLTVYLDGDANQPVVAPQPAADCPLELPPTLPGRDRTNRALVVGQLTGAGAPQIVLGTPTTPGGSGAVSLFTVDATTGVATCAFTYRNPDARFGHALATGDFDGDGTADLLVGAPPSHAFWIRGPLTAASAVLSVKLTGAGGGELGSAVAALDVDGKPGDEALVGDPDATVDGKTLAGEVRVVGGAMLDTELPTLRHNTPGANDAFGAQVRALPFCTAGCGTPGAVMRNLVLVGAATHTFTYFVLSATDKDPRKP
jgi:hypothetical protein